MAYTKESFTSDEWYAEIRRIKAEAKKIAKANRK